MEPTTHDRTVATPPPVHAPPAEVPNDVVLSDAPPVDHDEPLTFDKAPPAELPSPVERPERRDVYEPFEPIQRSPSIVGGMAALMEEVEYPERARRAGIEGKVFLEFVVRSPHQLLSDAAVEALKAVTCEPGLQRDRPVRVRMHLPVAFSLSR